MRIGEVARRSGVSARMLRHYDSLGLVSPSLRTSAGYREYTPDDIERIAHVEMLRSLGLSLSEVASALDDPEFTPSALVSDLVARTAERVRREQELLRRLRRVDEAGPRDWDETLSIVALLSGLESPAAGHRQRAAFAADDVHASAETLVEALLTEPDANVAGTLRWALSRAPGAVRGDAVASLSAELSGPDVRRRRDAVLALTEFGGDDAAHALVAALADTDPVVRSRAALALADRGEPTVTDVLVGLIEEGTGDVEAAEALGELAHASGDPGAVAGRLVDALGDADLAARRRLTQALGEIPGEGATQALAALQEDHDPAVRLTAVYLSGRRE